MTPVDTPEGPGHVLEMPIIPKCDFCGTPAQWNGPTIFRSWAYMCGFCEPSYHVPPGKTGVDAGQRLLLAGRNERDDALEKLEHRAEHDHLVRA